MRIKTIAAALLAAGIASLANASVVFNGGAPDRQNGLFANAGYIYSASATRFLLSAPLTFNTLTWWGGYGGYEVEAAPDAGDRFRLGLFDVAGDLPGNLLTSLVLGSGNRQATGHLVAGAFPEYSYRASFADISLGAGTYFLGLSNRYTGTGNWFWETTSEGQQLHGAASFNTESRSWETADYDDVFHDLAFQLSFVTPVPEPASVFLLGAGLLTLAAARRRAAGRGGKDLPAPGRGA